ncbi:MAG: hypothetical protein P8I97_07455 [Verrucomicrobiales bacterium]|nr:hypothetical protein [Verrucomicrobiales bacterium]
MRIVTCCSRSGSSFICQLLHCLGADFGSDKELVRADEWNSKGYFENKSVNKLNHELLFGPWSSPNIWIESMWPKNPLIRLRKISSLALAPLVSRKSLIQKRSRKKSDHIISISKELNNKIVKDPRFCYLMDPWQTHGSIDSVLFVLRHPWESASSMTRQTGLPLPLTYAGWKDSILNFWNIKHKYPVHIVDYNSLFQKGIASNAMEPLFQFLDIKFDSRKANEALSSTLDKKMRRYQGTEKQLPKSIKTLYEGLLNKAANQ